MNKPTPPQPPPKRVIREAAPLPRWLIEAWCRLTHRADWRLVYEHRNTYREYRGYICGRCGNRRLVATFTPAMFIDRKRKERHVKPLLVVKSDKTLTKEQYLTLRERVEVLGEDTGTHAVLLDGGLDAEVHHDLTPLVEAIREQSETITRLIGVQTALLDALAGEEGEPEQAEPATYLDGSPIK